MSEEMLKNLIESYDPYKVSADEINGLSEMLKHDSFASLHPIIIKKIKEIEAVVKTRKKATKKAHTQTEKATRKRTAKTSTPMTEDEHSKMVDEMIPVLWFTYLVDKTITDSINEKDKKDNPKKP